MKLTFLLFLAISSVCRAAHTVGASIDHDEEAATAHFLRAPLLQNSLLVNGTSETLTNGDGSDSACVSFLKYADTHCLEGPTKKITFTTATAKGSPCMHNPNTKHYSVKDQYCDIAKNTWHETEYIGNENCHVKWYQKMYSPEKLKFTHDTCVGGYQLRYCAPGPCPKPGKFAVDNEDVVTGMPNAKEHPVSIQ